MCRGTHIVNKESPMAQSVPSSGSSLQYWGGLKDPLSVKNILVGEGGCSCDNEVP